MLPFGVSLTYFFSRVTKLMSSIKFRIPGATPELYRKWSIILYILRFFLAYSIPPYLSYLLVEFLKHVGILGPLLYLASSLLFDLSLLASQSSLVGGLFVIGLSISFVIVAICMPLLFLGEVRFS